MSEQTERLDAIEAKWRPPLYAEPYGTQSDVAYLLDLARKQQAAIDALNDWAGRNRIGFYDEAQDDAVALIRKALDGK